MRQYESCAGACREHRLELVSGGDYDQLTAAAAACRVRIEGLWAVVGELARTEPGPGEWRAAYEALQQSARSALRRVRPAAGGRDDELLSPAETVIVWPDLPDARVVIVATQVGPTASRQVHDARVAEAVGAVALASQPASPCPCSQAPVLPSAP